MAVRRLSLRMIFVALACAPFLVAACSGASDTGLFGSPAATDTSPTDPTTTPTADASPTSTATTAPTATVTSPVADDDAGPDAEPTPTGACTEEVEPNDNIDRATPFTSSFCGQLSSATDADFGEFPVPQGATGMAITHTETNGKVAYRYYLNGQLLPVTSPLPATPGAIYTVAIRLAVGSATNTPSYQLNVAFTFE